MINTECTRTCKACKKSFQKTEEWQRYCSDSCKPVKYTTELIRISTEKADGRIVQRCPNCFNDFLPSAINQVYCSRQCKVRAKDKRRNVKTQPEETHTCEQCGKQWQGRKKRYCSEGCYLAHYHKHTRREVTTICLHCNAEIHQTVGPGTIGRKYCDRDCMTKAIAKKRNKGTACIICGKRFPYDFKSHCMYCSDDCRAKGWAKEIARARYKGIVERTTRTHEPRFRSYVGIECRVDRETFMEWAIDEIYKFRLQYPNEIPSIDRIDPKGHYELNNIRVISLTDNALRSRHFLRKFGLKPTETVQYNLPKLTRMVSVYLKECGISKEAFDEAWQKSNTTQ